MALGQEAASLISQKFPPPVKLEFEKVRRCFIPREAVSTGLSGL
jgi:hypothetical protein